MIALAFSACSSEDTEECTDCNGIGSEDITMFVNSELTSCSDDSDAKCYYAQINSEIDEDAWEVWTNEICGFDFVPGYRYQLSVRRKKVGKDENGEKIYQYCLIYVVDKEQVFL